MTLLYAEAVDFDEASSGSSDRVIVVATITVTKKNKEAMTQKMIGRG
jgi:hypothetical protein